MKYSKKPEVKIAVITQIDTTQWEFGHRFLQTLVDIDARLMPELVGMSDSTNTTVASIEACEEYWAPDAIIDGPLGRVITKWNFFWRRKKTVSSWGCVYHVTASRVGERSFGLITLTARADKKVEWINLFSRLCALTDSKYATLHLRTEMENRKGAFSEEALESYGVDDFLSGLPNLALEERGLANLSWANFLGKQYASEVDVLKLRANGFGVEAIGEGSLITLTPSLFDVEDNFSLFSERRVALRNLFRPGLFRINEEPKPLPE